jgi:hypothetical protein
MNKRLLSVLITAMPFAVYGANLVPLPTKELTIVPMAKLNIPEQMKVEIMKNKAEEKQKGYHEMDSSYAQYLLNLKRTAPGEIKAFRVNNAFDTHLKNEISDIHLAFNFKPLTMVKTENIIGYAPIGSYVKEGDRDLGWSGIKAFFMDQTLGACAYSFFDLQISHGAVQLNAETTEYLVNHKPSSTSVEGSLNSGFVYNVNWFDETKMHQLECANMAYTKQTLRRLVFLANQIDKR